ncbi:hypothetical protein TREMEDRAFT_63259 [Tremella mesenterica DSM 1558]|uniref:uncharacterized protein n=1 Tax=Tremella mesenterica (strain ATCC 24925 / CBS 8224 / DSM 1558 / NBRC 9311 / NRRL Y-6157 / RJB 2259-6 / UBC 559-6) TaxID=578456 RepID=UPI0003F4928B|nr:uncharacterized protein TREMEDRAFT_63259 [Tremella mesenterica DSM 1558]EIW68796.1 hypothetical protein TREMEDRAFT_63259 [Tremella mesenterica DSM 1558]
MTGNDLVDAVVSDESEDSDFEAMVSGITVQGKPVVVTESWEQMADIDSGRMMTAWGQSTTPDTCDDHPLSEGFTLALDGALLSSPIDARAMASLGMEAQMRIGPSLTETSPRLCAETSQSEKLLAYAAELGPGSKWLVGLHFLPSDKYLKSVEVAMTVMAWPPRLKRPPDVGLCRVAEPLVDWTIDLFETDPLVNPSSKWDECRRISLSN